MAGTEPYIMPRDTLMQNLREYSRVYGPLPSLAIHPDTPGITTGKVILDTEQAANRIEYLEQALFDVMDAYGLMSCGLHDIEERLECSPLVAHKIRSLARNHGGWGDD